MQRKRVVVTGMGCITPLGNDVATTWSAAVAGRSGAGPITLFDATGFETRFAAEVKGFDADAELGKRLARRTDRFTHFALAAARQALSDADLVVNESNRDRIGVILGTGIGGMTTMATELEKFVRHGPRRISPFMVPMMLPDAPAAQVAIAFGARGPNMAIVTACASGSNAVGEAAEMIRRGAADAMISGGTESAIIPIAMTGFNMIEAISKRNEDPVGASRPFDLHRDGFVAAEGSAALILESLEHASARGARILSELTGYASTDDAYHMSAPAPNGAGAATCMTYALADAGLSPDQIDYINAHGTSTRLNDASETAAIKEVFGESAYTVPVSSTKSVTGHLMGAAGALEALFCILAIRDGVIPPTINYETPDPECDLDYVPNTSRKAELTHAMSNSFGFGGHNACLVFSRPNGPRGSR